MARFLLVAAVVLLLVWAVRRVIGAGPPRRTREGSAAGGKLGAPDRLVCGECGAEFDAEQHGWICPHCRK